MFVVDLSLLIGTRKVEYQQRHHYDEKNDNYTGEIYYEINSRLFKTHVYNYTQFKRIKEFCELNYIEFINLPTSNKVECFCLWNKVADVKIDFSFCGDTYPCTHAGIIIMKDGTELICQDVNIREYID